MVVFERGLGDLVGLRDLFGLSSDFRVHGGITRLGQTTSMQTIVWITGSGIIVFWYLVWTLLRPAPDGVERRAALIPGSSAVAGEAKDGPVPGHYACGGSSGPAIRERVIS